MEFNPSTEAINIGVIIGNIKIDNIISWGFVLLEITEKTLPTIIMPNVPNNIIGINLISKNEKLNIIINRVVVMT
tara:strand:+ start:553 stop:777 length:225 start_codon:yes stop_codon:yes gene_type:complete